MSANLVTLHILQHSMNATSVTIFGKILALWQKITALGIFVGQFKFETYFGRKIAIG